MIRAMRFKGFTIDMIEVENTIKSLQEAVDGKTETILIRDGGHMIVDRDALPKDKPYNNIASLIANTAIYGDAIIVGSDGRGFTDVPDAFMVFLNFPEDYFRPEA